MSVPNCSVAVHFRECQFEQGEWRGSLLINIWGALVAAAVYLTEHAPGLPWRARRRGADSVTLSLTLVLHHLPPPPSTSLSWILYCYLSLFPKLYLTLHPSLSHGVVSYLSPSAVTVIIFHLYGHVTRAKCVHSLSEWCCFYRLHLPFNL